MSAPPDQAPQSRAHMNYFPAPHQRPYGDGTNLRTSYCQFSTSVIAAFDCCSAGGDVRPGQRRASLAQHSGANIADFDIITN